MCSMDPSSKVMLKKDYSNFAEWKNFICDEANKQKFPTLLEYPYLLPDCASRESPEYQKGHVAAYLGHYMLKHMEDPELFKGYFDIINGISPCHLLERITLMAAICQIRKTHCGETEEARVAIEEWKLARVKEIKCMHMIDLNPVNNSNCWGFRYWLTCTYFESLVGDAKYPKAGNA